MRIEFATLFGLAWMAACPLALAQTALEDNADLLAIYKADISHEICGFAVSDAQVAAMAAASDKLEEKLELDEAAAQKLYDEATKALEKQKPSGLCDPAGEWNKAYLEILARFAK